MEVRNSIVARQWNCESPKAKRRESVERGRTWRSDDTEWNIGYRSRGPSLNAVGARSRVPRARTPGAASRESVATAFSGRPRRRLPAIDLPRPGRASCGQRVGAAGPPTRCPSKHCAKRLCGAALPVDLRSPRSHHGIARIGGRKAKHRRKLTALLPHLASWFSCKTTAPRVVVLTFPTAPGVVFFGDLEMIKRRASWSHSKILAEDVFQRCYVKEYVSKCIENKERAAPASLLHL